MLTISRAAFERCPRNDLRGTRETPTRPARFRPAPHRSGPRRAAGSMVSSTHEHHDYLRKRKFSVPVKREDVERDWKPRGYSCDLFVDPPGKAWTDFVHKEDELVALVRGRMEFTIGSDRLVLEPGDEVFIPAGAKHSTKNVGEEDAHWLYGYA